VNRYQGSGEDGVHVKNTRSSQKWALAHLAKGDRISNLCCLAEENPRMSVGPSTISPMTKFLAASGPNSLQILEPQAEPPRPAAKAGRM